MLTLTSAQTHRIAGLQRLAERTYHRYDYHGSGGGDNPVQIAALSDSAADASGRELIADGRGRLGQAVVVAVCYIGPEWDADDGPTRVSLIVLPDGTTYGAPYDLTGEITVTAPFDAALLDDGVPEPLGHDLEHTLRDELSTKLTTLAAHVFQKSYRAREAAG